MCQEAYLNLEKLFRILDLGLIGLYFVILDLNTARV